jgi:hypothetical protein
VRGVEDRGLEIRTQGMLESREMKCPRSISGQDAGKALGSG